MGDQRQKAMWPWKREKTVREVGGAVGPGTPEGSAANFLTLVQWSKRINLCHFEPLWLEILHYCSPRKLVQYPGMCIRQNCWRKTGLTKIPKDISQPVCALRGHVLCLHFKGHRENSGTACGSPGSPTALKKALKKRGPEDGEFQQGWAGGLLGTQCPLWLGLPLSQTGCQWDKLNKHLAALARKTW